MTLAYCMCQEKQEEEDLPAVKIASMYPFNDLRVDKKKVLKKADYTSKNQCRLHKHQQRKKTQKTKNKKKQ